MLPCGVVECCGIALCGEEYEYVLHAHNLKVCGVCVCRVDILVKM